MITKLLKRALNNRMRSDKAENTKFGISRKNNIKNVHFVHNNPSVSANKLVGEIYVHQYAPMTPYKTSQIGFDLPGPICPLKQADFWAGGFKIFIFFFSE